MELENTYIIEKEDNNYEKSIWGSIDPKNGDICLYSKDLSDTIETQYQKFLLDPQYHTISLTEYYNCKIKFINSNYFKQTTKNGNRSVWRQELLNNEESITILKSVLYDSIYCMWTLKIDNTILDNIYIVSPKDNTYENSIWGSIDPLSGKICIYPVDITNKIEEKYQEYLLDPLQNSIGFPEYHNVNIIFNSIKSFSQQTPRNGYRSVWRETDNNRTTSITIMKSVIYNNDYKAWYLKRDIVTHLGFLVDTSGSMHNLYHKVVEKGIEELVEKQKELDHEVKFYGLTFANKVNTIFNGVNLKTEPNIRDAFYSINPRGCTCYYDGFIEMIDIIDKEYQIGDEVIICAMTDGDDNASKKSPNTLKDMIIDRKKNGWIVVMFGTKEVDVENTCAIIGLERDECLEIGTSDENSRNAYRSVSNGIDRVRAGTCKKMHFTPLERNMSC